MDSMARRWFGLTEIDKADAYVRHLQHIMASIRNRV